MILFLLILSFSASVNAALVGDTSGATLSLTPATASYYQNDSFTVSINLNTRGKSIVTVAAYVNYDTSSFQAVSVDTAGTAFNTAQFETLIDEANGKIKITLGKQTPGINSSNALVAKINFTALAATSPTADNITFDFTPGSIIDSNAILNDGLGTDILSGVNNVRYTILPPDVTPPALAQVTAAPTATKDTTPNYTFSSTEAGTITYGGDCSSATTKAIAGNNTITFNTLADGVHDNCTIQVTDAVGNQSLPLAVNSITIDSIAPTLTQATPIPSPISFNTPTYTFSSNEAGVITYGGDCKSTSVLNAVVGNNTVTFDAIKDGTHSNCTIRVADAAGNQSAPLLVNTFTVDATAPILTQVTAVPSPTNNITPSYTFRSSEAGTITYGGDCSSVATNAIAGNNTITFNTLADGTYNNCTIQVTDALGNQSQLRMVNSFTIDTVLPIIAEVTPVPTLIKTSKPSYTFSSTKAGTIIYGGDCSSATTKAVVGNNMVTFNTLAEGTHNNCTIQVKDTAGNYSEVLAVTPFTSDTIAPSITNVVVTRTINSATISWNTSESATSQVNYGLTTSYPLSSVLDTTMATDHTVNISDLKTNAIYHFRVRSIDSAGNERISSDYTFRTYATADLNLDGYVNSIDVGMLMSSWGLTSRPPADINQDGIVNSVDAGIMMSQWLS